MTAAFPLVATAVAQDARPHSASQARARAIMGTRFFSPQDAMDAFGVRYSVPELDLLSVVPYSDEWLERYRGTRFLFPGYPLTLRDLNRQHPDLFQQAEEPRWFDTVREWFAHVTKPAVRWYLVNVGAYERLRVQGETPHACEFAYLYVLHALVRRNPLVFGQFMTTRDSHAKGRRVFVRGESNGFLVGASQGEH